MLELEEYWDEIRFVVLLSTADEAAEDLVSFNSFNFNSAVLNWDYNYWILAVAVLNLSSSYFSRPLPPVDSDCDDFNLSIYWTKLLFYARRDARVLSVSIPEFSALTFPFSISIILCLNKSI